MKNAFGYSRVSGQSQVNGDGHPRQLEAISRCAKDNDLFLCGFYQEDAVPGKNDLEDRPQFQKMLANCNQQIVSVIVVESLDRFAREYAVQEKILTLLVTRKLTLIAANTGENVTEAFMGDPMRRALVQIQGIFAELDKNLIVRKLSQARQRAKENGEMCEGQPPYGYFKKSPVGQPTSLIPNPREQDTIQLIGEMAKQGYNPRRISARLNALSVPTRHGKHWTAVQVRRILARPEIPQEAK